MNTSLIPGNIWLKSYTWWNVRIFQRHPWKKIPLWEWKKMDYVIFLFSWSLKIKNKSGRLFRSSCIIISHPSRKKRKRKKKWKERKKGLAFTIQNFFGVSCSFLSHSEINREFLTSQHRLLCCILHCKTIALLTVCISQTGMFGDYFKGEWVFSGRTSCHHFAP